MRLTLHKTTSLPTGYRTSQQYGGTGHTSLWITWDESLTLRLAQIRRGNLDILFSSFSYKRWILLTFWIQYNVAAHIFLRNICCYSKDLGLRVQITSTASDWLWDEFIWSFQSQTVLNLQNKKQTISYLIAVWFKYDWRSQKITTKDHKYYLVHVFLWAAFGNHSSKVLATIKSFITRIEIKFGINKFMYNTNLSFFLKFLCHYPRIVLTPTGMILRFQTDRSGQTMQT